MEKMAPAVCSANNDVQGWRKASTFHGSLWGDFFLTYQPPTAPQRAHMTERSQVLKEEVRKMLKGAHEVPKILDLVFTLQRLGLDSHYENKIDELLNVVYRSNNYDDKDLGLVSLRFYLLRKSGYDVPSDVFLNFKDEEGNFVAHDIKGLLGLYNASYLRTHGEKVLDEAIVFTKVQLEAALLGSLEPTLADEVSLALETPLFRRVRILETRNYIPIYEREATRNDAILELAILNFNLLQLLYCEELKLVTTWWKELDVEANFSFVRDRIVELHFWMTGACSEAKYSLSRVILTKMTSFITIIDDIMDTYGTTEEAMLLAEAIYRWEETAVELLPEYMKGFYMFFLKTFDSLEAELGRNESYRVFYLKEVLKTLVRGGSQEIKWRDERYTPETISEHIEVSGLSVGAFQVAVSALTGMVDIVRKEDLDWLLTYPKLTKCLTTISRLCNDVASTKREQTEGHHSSTVQFYMLRHGSTMHEACEKIRELVEDAWKDMMLVYVATAEQPRVVARTVVDVARTADYMYSKRTDAFTVSHTIRDMIALLYTEPALLY